MVTIVELKDSVPKNMRVLVTTDLVTAVNALNMDDEERSYYRDNLLTLGKVLEQGRWSVPQYLNAVRFITYKLMGCKNNEAYAKTFSAKFNKFKANGIDDKTISRYVTAYSGSKLVTAVYEAASIPFYMINRDYRQQALMVQVDLMKNAKSEMVRTTAASSVLSTLEPPKESKIELSLGEKDVSVIAELRDAVSRLACEQAKVISTGSMTAKQIAATPLIIEGQVDG